MLRACQAFHHLTSFPYPPPRLGSLVPFLGLQVVSEPWPLSEQSAPVSALFHSNAACNRVPIDGGRFLACLDKTRSRDPAQCICRRAGGSPTSPQCHHP